MTKKDAKRLQLFGWLAAVAALCQTIGLVRYIKRLPDDWIGIALYAVTLMAFVLVGVGSFIQANQKS